MTEQEQIDWVTDMVAMREEELHPDLVPYLMSGRSMALLNHPLVQSLLPINGMVNRQYEAKKQALAEAIAAEDWHTVVFLHERPYRCAALIDYVLGRDGDTGEVLPITMLSDPDLRDVVVDVWTDSENIRQHVEDWLQITDGHTPGEALLFANDAEREEFHNLPDRLELWRGDCNDGGWSWSLDRKVGEFFARRFSADHALLHGWVDKRNVFGYITRRGESEVMVRREFVRDIETIIVSGNEE